MGKRYIFSSGSKKPLGVIPKGLFYAIFWQNIQKSSLRNAIAYLFAQIQNNLQKGVDK